MRENEELSEGNWGMRESIPEVMKQKRELAPEGQHTIKESSAHHSTECITAPHGWTVVSVGCLHMLRSCTSFNTTSLMFADLLDSSKMMFQWE
jgi:hypothetical protein